MRNLRNVRSGLLVTGLVLFFGFGYVAYDYYPGYTACNSFAGQIYQFLGGQDCNQVYAIFYVSILLVVVGLILMILGAALSEPRETPAPSPQVVYVQQPPPAYAPPPQAYVAPPPPNVAPPPPPISVPPASIPANTERICVSCGNGNDSSSAFCIWCGKPLPPPSLQPPPPTPAPTAGRDTQFWQSLGNRTDPVSGLPVTQPPTQAAPTQAAPAQAVERYCPSCGGGNSRASAFCESCGKPLPTRP